MDKPDEKERNQADDCIEVAPSPISAAPSEPNPLDDGVDGNGSARETDSPADTKGRGSDSNPSKSSPPSSVNLSACSDGENGNDGGEGGNRSRPVKTGEGTGDNVFEPECSNVERQLSTPQG